MTVRITSPVLGLAVGASYTGAQESWLLNEGYATSASSVPDAWVADGNGVPGAAAPSVSVTPVAAVLTAGANAATISGAGTVDIGTKGGARTTVTFANSDNAAALATKIDTALAGKADAAIVSSKLVITSTETGPQAYVSIASVSGANVATALGVSVGDQAYGTDGRPAGASNVGKQAADPSANDLQAAANREEPYYPATPDETWTIANDADNLNELTFPNPSFDHDAAGTDNDAPGAHFDIEVSPVEGPEEGGTVLTFTGSAISDDLVGVTAITVGGVACTSLDVSKAADGIVKATTGAHAPGLVNAVLTDASGNATLTGVFTYLATP